MLKTPQVSLIALALLAGMVAPEPLHRAIASTRVLAQAAPTAFPIPSPVPTGTLQVDGSASMTVINEYLKQQFETEYLGTQVQLETRGTDAALQALVNGEIDLAAVGRPLTDAEKAQGLVEVPISREKIAIIVGSDNPFTGNLTFEQFARIFRGEVINWSQIGGPDRAIRLVDRPETSDTRRALSTYAVFQTAPFVTGKTAVPVSSDETAAVIEALGADGVGYAIYSQVAETEGVKIVPMHQTLPDNPAYPFSQPRSYVYYQQPSPLAAVLLNYATSPDGQATVAEAKTAEAEAVASGKAIASGVTPATDSPSSFTALSSPDGSRVLRLGASGQPQVFDAQGNPVGEPLTGLAGTIQTAAFNPDGTAIAVGDDAGTLGFWSADGAALGTPLALGGAIAALTVAANGEAIDVALADGSTQTVPFPSATDAVALSPIASSTVPGTDAAEASAPTVAGTPTVGIPTETYDIDPGRAVFPWLWWLLALLGLLGLWAWWASRQRQQAGTPIPGYGSVSTSGTVPPSPGGLDSGDRSGVTEPTPPDLAERAGSVISADRAGLAAGATGAALGSLGAIALLGRNSRITLEPRAGQQAYAFWDVLGGEKREVKGMGGQTFGVRLYDVTGIDVNQQPAHGVQSLGVDENIQDLTVVVPEGDRDYLAEVGYSTEDGNWLPIARSNTVRVEAIAPVSPVVEPDLPADLPGSEAEPTPPAEESVSGGVPLAGLAGAGLAGLGLAGLLGRSSRITLEPRPGQQGYAVWQASGSDKQTARDQGGEQFGLRLYDVTAIDMTTQSPHGVDQFDCDENLQDLLLPIPTLERDYLAEIGYTTGDGRWLAIARSTHIRLPAEPATNEGSLTGAAALGAAGLGAAALGLSQTDDLAQSQVEATKYNVGQSDLTAEALASVDDGLADLPEGYGESRIVLLPRDPQWAYAYWDVPDEHRQELRRQGGERLALRFYDVTQVDLSHQNPRSVQQYDCDEMARDWYIPVPVSDRDYIAEIGYVAADGRWLSLARSAPIHIPPIYPSDWYDEQFIAIDWQDDLRGKTFLELVPPGQRPTFDNPIYDRIFGLAESAEAQRVAGSLFGSMQQVPGSVFGSMQMASGQALSSFSASGAAIGSVPGFTVPTLSGIGMSGMGMSGIGMMGAGAGMVGLGMSGAGLTLSGAGWMMSGMGFAASMPPLRARKFWLIADAELIIYGATEPDATVTIAGRPVTLNPDGTFRFQMPFQDGLLDSPIRAVAVDGEQTRSIHLSFVRETPERNTNTREDASDELF